MQISPSLSASLAQPAAAALSLLGRLAQAMPAMPVEAPPQWPVTAMQTEGRIRAALLEMGLAAAEADIALADALAQAGLPLTAASLSAAYGALARAPGTIPQAYALALTLDLPPSPEILRALTITFGAQAGGQSPQTGALPERVMGWLGLGVEAGTAPPALARHLREWMLQTGRSTEHRLLAAGKWGDLGLPITDARTALLRLSLASGDPALRTEADALASHLEGQQLLNQAAVQASRGRGETSLYFAVPLGFGGEPGMAEMRLWTPNSLPDGRAHSETDAETDLRVTVRVAPPRLGRVQAELSGRLSGSLTCRLGVERAASQRLLARHTGQLAETLSDAGWACCQVTCRPQPEWPPLWHGGDSLLTPRRGVDHCV